MRNPITKRELHRQIVTLDTGVANLQAALATDLGGGGLQAQITKLRKDVVDLTQRVSDVEKGKTNAIVKIS